MNNFDLKKFLTENKLTSNSRLQEDKKLTLNDFVQMVRDDMMAGSSPDEKPSEEQVKKKAKAYYNDYLQGSSVDDLFESNTPTTVWSNLALQFLIDNKVRYVKGVGGNPQIDWHLIALGFRGAEEKALGQLDNWKASMERSLGIEPHEEVRIEGGVLTTDKINQANDEAGASQASAMKKGGFSNN